MNKTEKFVDEVWELRNKEIPSHVYDKACRSLLDYIGVTVAGAKTHSNRLSEYIEFADIADGTYSAIGMTLKTSLKEAVFLNGLNAHALDFDDGTNTGIIHLGSPIFSVLIPLAQKRDISIEKMIKAAVVGYETSFTMAVSIQPTHKQLGYHATATCGILGITMAVATLLDFTKEEAKRAFSIAAVSATGSLKSLDDNSELKPFNVAKAALLGLSAIQMAKAGFICNDDALSGRGFLKMMYGDENIELKKTLLDGTYAIEKTYTKPYAACRYCHPAIEAAILLKNQVGANSIQNISVETYDLAVAGHDHIDIKGSNSAKMSIPYGICSGLIYGKAGLEQYKIEKIDTSDIKKLISKIKVASSERFSREFPKKQGALVSIETETGEVISKEITYPKGEPENPLNEQEFYDRFEELLEFAQFNKADILKIYETCKNKDVSVSKLCEYL